MNDTHQATRVDDREQCAVCHRPRHLTQPNVCDPCRDRIRTQLADLPPMAGRLTLATAGPQPRLGPLSAAGPGCPDPVPDPTGRDRAVLRQRTGPVTVIEHHDGQAIHIQRRITWRQLEPIRDAAGNPVIPDDQTGTIPVRVWADTWVAAWRRMFGHHTQGIRPSTPAETRQWLADQTLHQTKLFAARSPAASTIYAWILAAKAADRAYAARQVMGLHGYRNPAELPDGYDPQADEWQIRFGPLTIPRALVDDIAYLHRHLDAACNRGHAVAEFAAELRAMHTGLTALLGETSDLEWLGRCPTHLLDRDTGDETVCGASLWQDPYVSVIECPRCHCTWPEREHLVLAARIRWEWPIDRRRRYTAQDIADMRDSRCGDCGTVLEVEWLDATEPREKEPRWRPGRVECPACAATEEHGQEAA